MPWEFIAGAIDVVLRETLLFAGLGILLGGLDDLVVDLFYLVLSAHRAIRRECHSISDLPSAAKPLRLIVFVAAWDEAAVIGTMLRTAFDLASWNGQREHFLAAPVGLETVEA